MIHTSTMRAVMGWLPTTIDRVTTAVRRTHNVASEGRLPSLDGATAWLNSGPLANADLRGKVVTVQFWSYSCIEWLRTFAYLVEWSDRYREAGLVVIGVHTPEHSFERDIENVRRAVEGLGITYPIAIDNRYAISQAFKNGYTPTLYVADASHRIRRHILGDQGYDDAEVLIRQLLADAHPNGWVPPLPSDDAPLPSRIQPEVLDHTEVPDR